MRMRLRVPREVLMLLFSKMWCNATAEVKASMVHLPVVPLAHHALVQFLGEQRISFFSSAVRFRF